MMVIISFDQREILIVNAGNELLNILQIIVRVIH